MTVADTVSCLAHVCTTFPELGRPRDRMCVALAVAEHETSGMPSLHLGLKETKQTTTERHRRHVERAETRKTTDAKLQEERVAVEEAEGRAVESDGTGTAPGVSEIAPGFACPAHCQPL